MRPRVLIWFPIGFIVLLLSACSFITENADGTRSDIEAERDRVGAQDIGPGVFADLDLTPADPDDIDFGGPLTELRLLEPGDRRALPQDFVFGEVLAERHLFRLEGPTGSIDYFAVRVFNDDPDVFPGEEWIMDCTATVSTSGGGAGCGGELDVARSRQSTAGAMSSQDEFILDLHGGSDAIAFVVEEKDRRIGILAVGGFGAYASARCPRSARLLTIFNDGTTREEAIDNMC